jgi:hypothetical protein
MKRHENSWKVMNKHAKSYKKMIEPRIKAIMKPLNRYPLAVTLRSDTLKRLAIASNVDPAVDSSSRYLDVGRASAVNQLLPVAFFGGFLKRGYPQMVMVYN